MEDPRKPILKEQESRRRQEKRPRKRPETQGEEGGRNVREAKADGRLREERRCCHFLQRG